MSLTCHRQGEWDYGIGDLDCFLIPTLVSGEGGGYECGDPWINFASFSDHFGPFCSLLLQLLWCATKVALRSPPPFGAKK